MKAFPFCSVAVAGLLFVLAEDAAAEPNSLKAFFASEGFAGAPLQRRLKENLGPEFILGEATPAPLEKLQGQYRFHILMRGAAILRLSRRVRETLDKLPFPEDVAVAVDVDPYQLL
jgi:Primosomal protein N C-terminal domain